MSGRAAVLAPLPPHSRTPLPRLSLLFERRGFACDHSPHWLQHHAPHFIHTPLISAGAPKARRCHASATHLPLVTANRAHVPARAFQEAHGFTEALFQHLDRCRPGPRGAQHPQQQQQQRDRGMQISPGRCERG
jgi:hypothetical protein